uniref:Uncharacterized protein n=1 Tax=Timema monikensis TaxID=170555 RepID=A0A7R9HRR9_9NEOP|nr:unnamed protein product [Timema monikensis]
MYLSQLVSQTRLYSTRDSLANTLAVLSSVAEDEEIEKMLLKSIGRIDAAETSTVSSILATLSCITRVCHRVNMQSYGNMSTAEELLKHFLDGISPLLLSKLIQVSMYGPNVNFKFITLQEKIKSVTDWEHVGFMLLMEELNHVNIINDVLAENTKKEYLHFYNLKKSQQLQEIFRPCYQFSDEVGLDTIYVIFQCDKHILIFYRQHWFLAVICFPGLVEDSIKTNTVTPVTPVTNTNTKRSSQQSKKKAPAHKISKVKVKLHEVSNIRDEANGADSEMEDEVLAIFPSETKEPATDNNLKNTKKSKLKIRCGTPIDKSFKHAKGTTRVPYTTDKTSWATTLDKKHFHRLCTAYQYTNTRDLVSNKGQENASDVSSPGIRAPNFEISEKTREQSRKSGSRQSQVQPTKC